MPSLKTNNRPSIKRFGTFDYAIGVYTSVGESNSTVTRCNVCRHVAYIMIVFVLVGLSVLSIDLLGVYIGSKYATKYKKYKLFLLNDFFYLILGFWFSFGYLMCKLIHIQINQNAHYLLCFVIYIILNGFLCIWIRVNYDSNNYNLTNLFGLDCRKLFECDYFTIWHMYFQIFMFFLPVIHCALLLIIMHVSRVNPQNSSKYFPSPIASRTNHKMNIHHENSNYLMLKCQRRLILYLILYWIIFVIFSIVVLFAGNVKMERFSDGTYWQQWFVQWLFVTSITKFVLKRISRSIDTERIKYQLLSTNPSVNYADSYNTYHLKFDQQSAMLGNHVTCTYTFNLFSMEWISEVFLSLVYWFMYRACYVSHIMHLNKWNLIFLLVLHLISESIETNIRLSKTYFDLTRKFLNCINVKHKLCHLISVFYNNCMFDDSNYSQWTKRYSIDITIRFIVAIITGICQLLLVILAGKYIYIETQNDENHVQTLKKKAIECTLISLFSEIVYYLSAVLLHYLCNGDNLLGYFVSVWKTYQKEFILVFVCGLLITNYMYSNNVTGVSV